eukprot:7372359-Alexandrium_andersonii.AAC.1
MRATRRAISRNARNAGWHARGTLRSGAKGRSVESTVGPRGAVPRPAWDSPRRLGWCRCSLGLRVGPRHRVEGGARKP